MTVDSKTTAKMTSTESTDAINDALARLAGATADHETVTSGIRNHTETYIAKPEPMSNAQLAEIATKAAFEEKQVEPYIHTFDYRPWDVALAAHRVWKQTYSHTPSAKRGRTAQIEVPTGPTTSITVPFGTFDVVELRGEMTFDQTGSTQYGQVGQIIFQIPKKLHPVAQGICKLIADDLKVNSIYKNKAITSEAMPKFLNPYVTHADKIVWSRPVDAALRGSLINVIKYTDRARERGQQIHRSALFYGEPGNGKTESMNIVAQTCMENGWSFVLCTTNLTEAMQTARLLAPAVVAIEDIERLVAEASPEERSALLEELDGTTSKGKDIMLVATTNYISDLEKAFRRRMFKEIEFGAFDVSGAERFLRIKLDGQCAPDAGNTTLGDDPQAEVYTDEERSSLDYAQVARAMDGWGNSYISKVTDFAAGLALEHETPELTTADLLDAVEAQRSDWEGYKASQARPTPNRFDTAFKELVSGTMSDNLILESDDGTVSSFVLKS